MASMKDREKAFESKFAHDAEMQFKAAARRNKLLGLWLAPKLGVEDEAAYARAVVVSDLAEDGEEDVVRKVMADIAEHKASVTEAELRAKMAELTVTAKAELLKEADK